MIYSQYIHDNAHRPVIDEPWPDNLNCSAPITVRSQILHVYIMLDAKRNATLIYVDTGKIATQ